MGFFHLYTLFVFTTIVGSMVWCTSLSDSTNTIGLSDIKGTFAAYGDFNSDQATDIFVISYDCKSTSFSNQQCSSLFWILFYVFGF